MKTIKIPVTTNRLKYNYSAIYPVLKDVEMDSFISSIQQKIGDKIDFLDNDSNIYKNIEHYKK